MHSTADTPMIPRAAIRRARTDRHAAKRERVARIIAHRIAAAERHARHARKRAVTP